MNFLKSTEAKGGKLFLKNIAMRSCVNQSQNKNIVILVIKCKIAINMFSNISPQKMLAIIFNVDYNIKQCYSCLRRKLCAELRFMMRGTIFQIS